MTPEAEAIREIFLQIRPEIMWLVIQSLAYTLITGIILGIGIVEMKRLSTVLFILLVISVLIFAPGLNIVV